MDPVAHTFTGAALAGAGLRRATPLATGTLVLAANAPDVDILVHFFGGGYAGLAFRRGWTHGVLALALWPFVLAGLALAWDRWVRRRRDPDALPARARPLLLLAAIGVLTHPTLDWLNNYGMRWLMPFEGRWFYGDALFIIDPYVWLALGGALFLMHSKEPAQVLGWAAFAAAASALVLWTAPLPAAVRAIWAAGLAAVVALRLTAFRTGGSRPAGPGLPDGRPGRPDPARRPDRAERAVRWAAAAVAAYMAVNVAANPVAQRIVRQELAAAGSHDAGRIMVAPVPANPFAGQVLVETPDAYLAGSFHWLRRPRLALDGGGIPRRPPDEITRAAAAVADARDYLVWARFPFFVVEETAAGYRVRVADARYAGFAGTGLLRGLTVELDRELRPVAPRDGR